MAEPLQDEIGVVAALEAGQVTVHFQRSSACGKCGACGMLSDSSKTMVLTMEDPGGLAVGDRVRLIMVEKYFMMSTLLLYAVPLAALVLGIGVGYALWGEAGQGAAGLLGLALAGGCYLVYRSMNARFLRWRKSQISLQRVETPQEECSESQ